MKERLKEYEEKKYDTNPSIPFVIDNYSKTPSVEEQADLVKIKSMIDNYVKSLNQTDKNVFKHDLIDFIYKKCN